MKNCRKMKCRELKSPTPVFLRATLPGLKDGGGEFSSEKRINKIKQMKQKSLEYFGLVYHVEIEASTRKREGHEVASVMVKR